MTEPSHKRSLVVWDLPPAIACGSAFTIRIGIKCDSRCRPGNWGLEVRDHEGRRCAGAVAGETAWPGTEALYGAELELEAPAAEGLYAWSAVATAVGQGSGPAPDAASAGAASGSDESAAAAHEAVAAGFIVRTVPEADCRLTVVAVERETQTPIEGARVVAHPFRAVTNAQGVAELELPQGRYRVFVSGRAYFPLRIDGDLAGDTTIRAELELEPGPSDAELWA